MWTRMDIWFFGWLFAYLIAGSIDVFVFNSIVDTVFIQIVWIVMLGLPIYLPSFRRKFLSERLK